MNSKRENLLERPWLEKKYENHRRKIQSASSVIDTKPPKYNEHVNVKLKKRQSEKERCIQIERDNLRLLQKLETIMKKNNLDNKINIPTPNIFRKVKLYGVKSAKSNSGVSSATPSTQTSQTNCSKHKCLVCFPQVQNKINDERFLPWEVKLNSAKSMSTIGTALLTSPGSLNKYHSESKLSEKPKSKIQTTNKVLLSHGNLNLAINFPNDTKVEFYDGNIKKIIKNPNCRCKFLSK